GAAVASLRLPATALPRPSGLLANRARLDARNSEIQARQAEHAARQQAAESKFGAAGGQLQAGDVAGGLSTLLDAWQFAPDDAQELKRVIRLNLAAWAPQLPVLRHALQGATPKADLPGRTPAPAWASGAGKAFA